MEALNWISVVIAITGAVLNARKNIISYYFWVVSNAMIIVLNLMQGRYDMVALFSVYLCICIYGLLNWRRNG
jgi:nicotinamide riboside transporter PnuC